MDNPIAEVREPYRIEAVPAVDLVACPSCCTVVTLAGIDTVEVREVEAEAFNPWQTKRVTGVFCPNPGCDQRLFDEESWIEHLNARPVPPPTDVDDPAPADVPD